MTMNVFGGLELAVGNAINAEEDARAKAAFDEYQEALDAAKAGSPRITNLFVGTENSGRVNYRLPEAGQWYNVFMQLAEQKLKGTIGELSVQELQPSVRGTIAGGALRALDLAFKPDYKTDVRGVIHHDDLKRKVRLGREAVAAMYVFGMTEDKAFLGALETGLQSLTASMGKSNQSKDEFSQSYLALCLGPSLGELFVKFGMVDDYHSDLVSREGQVRDGINEPRGKYVKAIGLHTLLAVLDAKLRPEEPLTDEAAFKKGFEFTSGTAFHSWPNGVYAAKVSYVLQSGEVSAQRASQANTLQLAIQAARGEITGVQIQPKDQGKLWGSVQRGIDYLMTPNARRRTDWQSVRFDNSLVADVLGGFYLLGSFGKLPDAAAGRLKELIATRTDLASAIKGEIAKYSPPGK